MQRRPRWRALGASLALTAAAGIAAIGGASPAAAQTTSSLAVVDVPAGDVLAAGAGGYFRLPTVAVAGTAAGITATVSSPAVTTPFVISVAPKTGGALATGTAETGTAATATASVARLTVSQGAAVCDVPSGSFTIHDVAFGGGTVTRLAMTFRLTCTTIANNPITSGYVYFAQPDGPLGSPQIGEFYPLTPKRLLDTRTTSALGAGGTVDVVVAGGSSTVPANAIAVVLNVTGVSPSQATFLTVYPAGSARPTASNVNPAANDVVPNLATVKVGNGGAVTLYNEVGTTHALVDVMGYFLPDDGGSAGGRFVGQTPSRVLDTRNTGIIGARDSRTITVDATATAAVLNVTTNAPTAPSFLTVFPTGESVPVASNLNFAKDQTIANLVVVKLNGGQATIYNDAGSTHVIVDVVGVFKAATGPTDNGGRFVPIAPARAYDSRNPTIQGLPNTPVGAGAIRDLGVPGLLNAYPFEYKGFIGNVTVTNTSAASFLTVYPAGTGTPLASNLNWLAGETRPNQVMIGTDQFGFNSFYNEAGTTDIVVDVAGYFTR